MTGESAAGVTVYYGRDNVINLRGSVQASGEGGYGAHFGFLSNPFSIYSHATFDVSEAGTPDPAERYENSRMNSDLAGALVKALNVTGTLAGTEAAVRIEMDAHVEEINIMKGASLRGDIVSYWNEIIPTAYTTNLTFGRTPDANGGRVYARDFFLRLGLFRWESSYVAWEWLVLNGGLRSEHEKLRKLKGNGVFTWRPAGFYMKARLRREIPSYEFRSTGTLRQNGGTFDYEFDGTSRDVLKSQRNAPSRGRRPLTPVRGLYGRPRAVSQKVYLRGAVQRRWTSQTS